MRTNFGRSDEEYGVRHTRRRAGRRAREDAAALRYKEKQRLIQLVVCILLFTVTLFGKGICPKSTEAWKESTLNVLQSDMDFKTAFVVLGRAFSDGEPILETLGNLWIEAVGSDTEVKTDSSISAPVFQRQLMILAQQQEQPVKRLGLELYTQKSTADKIENEKDINKTTGWAERTDAAQPELLDPQPQPANQGIVLPANCTMEKWELNIIKTTTPVHGVISSGFGYRTHPVDGENKFHYGIDMAADIGTPVIAFAGGVVDYIGESTIYGKYIKIRHDNGVTTFYAHCSKLCKKKGEKVELGDIIAKVGESGNTTGPHLHFEIRMNGIYLNPVNYIDIT